MLVLGSDIPAQPPVESAGSAEDGMSLRDAFCEHLAKQLEEAELKIGEKLLYAVAQQFYDSPEFTTVNLKNIAAQFFRNTDYRPGSLQHSLAQCPFRVILTTCYDDLFAKALMENGKTPTRYWYHYKGEPRENKEISSTSDPNSPTLYHLFGTYDEPNSLVLTENDLLDFVIHVIAGRPKLPDSLRSALRNKTFLFFGFGIRHWYLRVLLKLMVRCLELSGASVALESLGGLDATEKEQTVLFYKRGTRIEVVDMDGKEFVAELLKRLDDAGGYLGPTQRTVRRAQVFVSYERSDSEMANRLYETLPKEKFDVWLDTTMLQGGEDWNAELEEKLRTSDYFLVLNSENLREKHVGYVNKEIQVALDRQTYMAPGYKFIIPLLLNNVTAETGRSDLSRFQQLPLRRESFGSDVNEIERTMFRDFQLRLR